SAFPAREVVLASEAGLAVVGLGFGILQTIAVLDADGDVEQQQQVLDTLEPGSTGICARTPPPVACSDLASAIDDRDQAAHLATVGYVVGGVGVLSFVGTWLLWPPRAAAESDGGGTAGRSSATPRLTTFRVPGGAMASLAGTF